MTIEQDLKSPTSPHSPLSTVIRSAILGSGVTLTNIEAATGVKRQCISIFLAGKGSLRLDNADKLAAYFGIQATTKPAESR